MLESQVLKLLLVPANYRRFRRFVPQDALSRPGRDILRAVEQAHGLSEGSTAALTEESVKIAGLNASPHWEDDKRVAFTESTARMLGADVGAAPEQLLRTWVQREYAAKLAAASDEYMENPDKLKTEYVVQVADTYAALRTDLQAFATPEEGELDASFEDVLASLNVNSTVRWRLNCLNEAVGAPYPGFFGIFGGRPESGKTTLMVSELAHLLPQFPDGSMACIFNNESHRQVLRLRWMQSVIGKPGKWIKEDPARADKEYRRIMGDRKVLIKDVHGKSIDFVHEYLELYADKLSLIMFDQATKLEGFDKRAGNSAERQLLIAGQLRAWATQYAPIITTAWASGDAEGVDYIELSQIYGSKTGIPGEADVVVNLGHTHLPEDEGIRYINIPKNKSLSCPDETLRHSKHHVLMNGATARVENP